MKPVVIHTREDFESAIKRGFNPLCEDAWRLPMAIDLRREIQREMFGKHNAQGNARFYKYIIDHKPHVCEECGRPIRYPSAINVSHILSRGAHPELSFDPRDVNMLCPEHHSQWENGDREAMRIWEKNKKIIEKLKKEYQNA